jgi:hypothetical protein
MSELHKYYSQRLFGLLVFVLAAAVAMGRVHETLAEDHAAGLLLVLADLFNHHIVLIASLVAGELCIRKWLWRLAKPHLYFGGRWRGVTEYTEVWLNEDESLPEPTVHEVDIKQDCLGVSIAPTESEAFAQWHSLICDLQPPNGIAYAYKVTYNNKAGLPSSARGYEVLQVVGTTGRRGLPQSISGEFHHLVSNDKPVFSGNARFERVPKRRIWQLRSRPNRQAEKTGAEQT